MKCLVGQNSSKYLVLRVLMDPVATIKTAIKNLKCPGSILSLLPRFFWELGDFNRCSVYLVIFKDNGRSQMAIRTRKKQTKEGNHVNFANSTIVIVLT